MESNEWNADQRAGGTGDSTGSSRANDPALPGFTTEDDRLFRSHFQQTQRSADRSYEQVRPAYRFGFGAAMEGRFRGRSFEEIESDLRVGWSGAGGQADWEAVRGFAREGFVRGGRLGFVDASTPSGGNGSERPSFSDPVSAGVDPTAPDSPEQTLDYQAGSRAPATPAQKARVTSHPLATDDDERGGTAEP